MFDLFSNLALGFGVVFQLVDLKLTWLSHFGFTGVSIPVPMNIFECRPGQDKDTVCSEVIGVFR